MEVFPDLEELSRAAAQLFGDASREALRERGRFSVALAGGSTPRRTYELLARPPYRDSVDWPQVDVFWGDERCVAPEDPRSNERMAREALLDRVPIDATRIHPMRCEGDPADAAQRYEALLRNHFGEKPRFDLVLLGLGDDGHTASLLPGTDAPSEATRWAIAVKGGDVERLTLTPPALNAARRIAFLVSGAGKAKALSAALSGAPPIPAHAIAPHDGEVVWLVDRAAAELWDQSTGTTLGDHSRPQRPKTAY
jgi:6-phosphogluconolactonase